MEDDHVIEELTVGTMQKSIAAIASWVGSRAGAVVRKVVALSVSRVSPFVPA
jgi:hypothetical protein